MQADRLYCRSNYASIILKGRAERRGSVFKRWENSNPLLMLLKQTVDVLIA